jgi:undecaprenyl phosphate-alpha-L-ara4N flippase subunit ArnE
MQPAARSSTAHRQSKVINMSLQSIILAILTVLGLSTGQILFKLAAQNLNGVGSIWMLALKNTHLWIALLVYGVSTLFWILLLRQVPLKLAYPFVGCAFFIVPLLAHFFLGESLSWHSIVGAVLIASGIYVSLLGSNA